MSDGQCDYLNQECPGEMALYSIMIKLVILTGARNMQRMVELFY